MNCHFDLVSESQVVLKEILNYKWLESERAGQDIGLGRAAQEWIQTHYDKWFELNAQNFIVKK